MMQDRQNQQASGNVRVVVRFRPLNEREKVLGVNTIHELYDSKSVLIKEYRNDKPDKPELHNFNFDRTFDVNATQADVYTYAAKPVVDSVLEGFNGTVFAYGQTASGKTHTMEGSSIEGDQNAGVIPRMIKHVFDSITNSPDSLEFRIRVSMVQLYMEKLRDLLDVSKNDLKIRSDKKKGIYIEDLTENYISEPDEVFDMMKIAQVNRAICATNMNERSSRSHMIFILTISQNNLQDLSAKTGKLYLVDLAGSEKVGKTGAEGKILDEAKKINTSLATLGKVINALTDGKSTHVPYRDSKLTRVLQESLGGNSKTTLIVTCSPHHYNLPETLSTLRFGVSAKNIKNKPKINRELTVAELQMLLEKAESKIAEKDKQVVTLQDYIKNELKAKLPMGNTPDTPMEVSMDEVDDEKFKTIETELEIERNNNSVMTDKIGTLKAEMTQMIAKLEELERQNSSLLDKVVTLQSSAEAQDKVKASGDVNAQLLKKIYDSTSDQNIKKLLDPIINSQRTGSTDAAPSGHTSAVSEAILQQLQQNYESQRDRRRKAEDLITKNEKDLKKKINSLENNIQQLTTVYYDLFVEQSKWKVENAINLRRIEKKNILIASMENTINDLREELEQKQLSDQDSNDSFDLKQFTRSKEIKALKQFAHSKLVKPVRGGKPKP